MKTKNPLYVVKGKTVLEAKGVFDLIAKRLNLEPAIEMIVKVLKFLLNQVSDYPSFVMIKKIVDTLMAKITQLMGKFHHA